MFFIKVLIVTFVIHKVAGEHGLVERIFVGLGTCFILDAIQMML